MKNTFKLILAFIGIGLFTIPIKSLILSVIILLVFTWLLEDFSFLTFYYKAKLFIEKQKVDQIQEMLSSKFQVIDKTEEYNVRFPIAYHTVDIAILKKLNHLSTEPTTPETHLLLIQKPNETSWRFPGGFVDPSDNSAEHAAIREAHEEVGRDLELSKPQYITSVKIDDPRYKNSPHKIITSFYVVNYLWGKEKAGDDAEKAEWFNIKELFKGTAVDSNKQPVYLNDIHSKLFTALFEMEKLYEIPSPTLS